MPVQWIWPQGVHFHFYNWPYWPVNKWNFSSLFTSVRDDIWQTSICIRPCIMNAIINQRWKRSHEVLDTAFGQVGTCRRFRTQHCPLLPIPHFLWECAPVIESSAAFTHVSQNTVRFLLWVHFLMFGFSGGWGGHVELAGIFQVLSSICFCSVNIEYVNERRKEGRNLW